MQLFSSIPILLLLLNFLVSKDLETYLFTVKLKDIRKQLDSKFFSSSLNYHGFRFTNLE